MPIINTLLPQPCVRCQLATDNIYALCQHCESQLPIIKNACQYCATPISHGNCCGKCQTQPLFQKAVIPYYYLPPLSYWIAQLKFNQQLTYSKLFAHLFAQQLKTHYSEQELPQEIVPVPSHRKRLCSRGFNQTIEIAKCLHKLIKIPVNNSIIIKTKHTKPQSDIAAKERKKNLKGAFTVKKTCTSHTIAIFDDVITTGATIRELISTLQKNQQINIHVWCICQTPLLKLKTGD